MVMWFYKNGNKSIGPIDEGTMRDWIKQGSIAPSQMVRADGSDDWQRADGCFQDLMSTSKVPDLLADIAGIYFECDGLCFKPVLDTAVGKCRVNLYYQNRYNRDCRAQITLTPCPRGFWPRQTGMPPLTIEMNCAGGEFGFVRRLYAVPRDFQGKEMVFDLSGEATYPSGKGDMIRFRSGLRVLEREDTAVGIFRLLAVFGGIIITRKPAKMAINLPKGVAEVVPEGYPPAKEILWSLPNDDLVKKA